MDGGSAARVVSEAKRPVPLRPTLLAAPPLQKSSVPVAIAMLDAVDRTRTRPEPERLYQAGGKRVLDITLSLGFLLTVGFWLLPLIAFLIRLDSRGPALFRQERVGRDGRVFTCLKFRTMHYDPAAGFVQATRSDPRVTRLGRLLRRSNFDELPQFLNVLRGEMSVVGPRPHVPELDSLFSHQVLGYARRVSIRPGVTGLAQVSGARGETRSVSEMTQRVHFDLDYVRHHGVIRDISIMMRTVRCVLLGDDNAY